MLTRPAASGALPTTRSLLARLWPLVADRRATLASIVALGLVANLVESVAVSLIFVLAYWAFAGGGTAGAGGWTGFVIDTVTAVVGTNALMVAGLVVAAILGKSALSGAYSVAISDLYHLVQSRIRARLFDRYLTLPYQQVAAMDYGVLTNTLLDEAWRVGEVVQMSLRVVVSLCGLTVYALLILTTSWQLGVLIAVAAVVHGAIVLSARAPLRRLGKQATGLHEEMAERMVTRVQALRTIRAFGAERREIEGFTALVDRVGRLFVRLTKVDSVIKPVVEAVSISLLFAIAFASTQLGNSTATTVAVLALLYRMQPHMRELESSVFGIAGHYGSLFVVAEHLTMPPTVDEPQGDAPVPEGWATVAFHGVSFRHGPAVEPVLARASFQIRRGGRYALVGKSGSGKTTIVNLLLKLTVPTVGTITVGGSDLATVSRADWLSKVAVAGQDVDLLEGTIEENVTMRRPGLTAADARRALETVRLWDFIETLPDGLSTRVGERGLRLSGGQRQRVVLARALAMRPHLLILDEATSAVEMDEERRITEHVVRQSEDLTVMIITHRDVPMDLVDTILRVEGGGVVTADVTPDMRRALARPAR